jgi:Zn-dependent protease
MQDASAPVEEGQERRAAQAKFARDALMARRRDSSSIVMLLLLGAFVFWILRDSNVRQALVLIGVLLFHESGHLVSMRLFGFSDLRMFFLPGFGAAASGRKPGASAVEHAIVSLAGPLPGLVLAAGLLAITPPGSLSMKSMPLVTEIVFMLAILNAFNLVPIVPFDGGRFFETVLFSRWPALDALFRLVGIAGLAWFATQGMPLLGVVAAGLLVSLRLHARIAYGAVRLRRERPIAPDVAALSEDDLVALYVAAELTASGTGKSRTSWLAHAIVQLHDRAARQPAPWLPTLGLVLVWLLGFGLAAGELLWIARLHH